MNTELIVLSYLQPSDEVLVSGSEEEVEDDVEGADSDEENSGTELEPVQEDDV